MVNKSQEDGIKMDFNFKLQAIGASLNLVFAFISMINQQWLTMAVLMANMVLFAKVAADNDKIKFMANIYTK